VPFQNLLRVAGMQGPFVGSRSTNRLHILRMTIFSDGLSSGANVVGLVFGLTQYYLRR
jgi:hypothetical protein